RDMPAAFMLADVVVSASTDPEAFGRTIVEAQAMGRPVIAPDHGGARETVREGETGWLFRARDEASLADAIGRALALDADSRKTMAAAAIANVRKNFTRDLMCAETLRLYRRALALPPVEP
ncbi:MAG: glycosyltransferase, partial [Alphaproteobacteria bacterium]